MILHTRSDGRTGVHTDIDINNILFVYVVAEMKIPLLIA